ncbi:MAG: AraC family transcriptional regulator [Rariglobus sp.]
MRRLSRPAHPLHGRRRPAPPLPENIICFRRIAGAELNQPHQGRALHHRHVLIIPLSGKAVVCADDRETSLGPGKGLVILPYQYHHYARAERKLHWLFVTFEYAQGVALEPLRNTGFNVTEEMKIHLVALLKAQRDPNDTGVPELRLALLLAQLSPPPAGEADVNVALGARVNHALQRHRPATPKIAELAADLGMSPSHLRSRFRASCGVSLGRHMRELRLERACGLLRMTTTRISEVAEQCGFTSLFSFSRAFSARYGFSPRAYRQQAGKGAEI